MKERPILFSGPMVRALLAGTKTQTRRVNGLDVINAEPDRYEFIGITSGPGVPHFAFHDKKTSAQVLVKCPYGQPGDRLWVRETWRHRAIGEGASDAGQRTDYVYRATENVDGLAERWKPSIHMPRAASRITLEIVSVRVERLQDISEVDALAEGAPPSHPSIDRISREFGYADFPRSWYAQLWEQINGPGSWDANPWVWVVEFRKC